MSQNQQEISHNTLVLFNDFTNMGKKVKQGISIFNELYDRRAKCYLALAGKKPSFWRRITGKASAYETGDALANLRILNERERKVIDLFSVALDRIKNPIKQLDPAWKKEQSHLFVLEKYTEDVLGKQKEFLSQEYHFIESIKASPALSAQAHAQILALQKKTKEYFDLLDETATLIAREHPNFISPKTLDAFLREKSKENHALKQLDIIGGTAVFVGLFVTVSAFAHSIPNSLFETSRLPSAELFAEFCIIAYFLGITNIPALTYETIKSNTRDIIYALSTLEELPQGAIVYARA